MKRIFEVVRDDARKYPDQDIKLPERSTKYSAGYDFFSPKDFSLYPSSGVLIPTDIKAIMPEDEVLMIYPRSSMGKRGVMLSNTTAIIDSDFAGNENNDGNIGIMLYNYGTDTVKFYKGDKIAQGVFMKYMTTDDDKASSVRTGGIGSTGG